MAGRHRLTRRRWLAPWPLAALVVLAAVTGAVVWIAAPEREPVRAPPGLADYWEGRARWAFERRITAAALGQPNPSDGSHVEIVGDTWYLFNRRRYEGGCGDGQERLGVQVRRSSDRGETWSDPVEAIAPAAGTEWACQATDGDATYDARTHTWRYLFQCSDERRTDEDGGWNGCYAERAASDPMGPFRSVHANPVIRPGDLWGAICDPDDDCARLAGGPGNVKDEGTFDIFRFHGTSYWVAFHGSDGKRGFRGIAKTRSFARGSFEVDGAAADVPTDAVLDPESAVGFREDWNEGGPIGAGAGSIAEEDGYAYLLAEFPDLNLSCTAGQNWDFGIFRSRSLASTSWEAYPRGNPIVYSSRVPDSNGSSSPCNVIYPRLFTDPTTNERYLMHGRSKGQPGTQVIYLYRLEWSRNLLANGDFWRADAAGWSGSARRAVYRDPFGSPDGTPYLAFNCGASPCQTSRGVAQEVPATEQLRGREVSFGAELRVETGSGRAELALRQLDGAGRTIARDAIRLSPTPAYAATRRTVAVRAEARALRLELVARSPETFRADNLFVEPER